MRHNSTYRAERKQLAKKLGFKWNTNVAFQSWKDKANLKKKPEEQKEFGMKFILVI